MSDHKCCVCDGPASREKHDGDRVVLLTYWQAPICLGCAASNLNALCDCCEAAVVNVLAPVSK